MAAHDSQDQVFSEGLAAEKQGDLKRALRYFKAAAEQDPQRARFLEAVARTYEGLGKTSQASDWYLRAAQAEQAPNYSKLGSAAQSFDRRKESAWVQELQPNHLDQQEVLPTVEHLWQLLSSFGPDPTALRKLALLLGRLDKHEDAGRMFKEARLAEDQQQYWR